MTDKKQTAQSECIEPAVPERGPASESRAVPFEWIDSHTLLNAFSVLRHRVRSDHPGKLDALDAISAYYANGAYLQAHGSRARLDYWVEWLTCGAEVAGLARSRDLPCQVDPEFADLEGTFELGALGQTCARVVQHLVSLPDQACRSLSVGLLGQAAVVTVEATGAGSLAQLGPWPEGVRVQPLGPDIVSLRVDMQLARAD